jgi:hypothetical protein
MEPNGGSYPTPIDTTPTSGGLNSSPSSLAGSVDQANLRKSGPRDRKRPSAGALCLLEYAYAIRRRRGRVTVTVGHFAEHFRKSVSTVQRWADELTRAGLLLRAYNGGQGRRRACIWYVGPGAVARARAEFPAWEAAPFRSLILGREALERRRRLGRKNATLNPDHSSYAEGGDTAYLPPLGEPEAPEPSSSSSGAPPPDPRPEGGGETSPELAPSASPQASSPTPGPAPRGGETDVLRGRRARGVPLALAHAPLWRHAWFLWRAHFRSAVPRGRSPARSVVESNAMALLCGAALRHASGDYAGAVEVLAHWFARCVADPLLSRYRLVELWTNRRSYGWPGGPTIVRPEAPKRAPPAPSVPRARAPRPIPSELRVMLERAGKGDVVR